VDGRNLAEFDIGGETLSVPVVGLLNVQADSLAQIIRLGDINADTVGLAHVVVGLLGGLIGKPDEIEVSGEASILCANADAFHLARRMILSFPSLLRFLRSVNPNWAPGIDATRRSLRAPHWRVGTFVCLLHVVHRAGPMASELFDLDPIIIRKINELCDNLLSNRGPD
jgi:hypothetical protein